MCFLDFWWWNICSIHLHLLTDSHPYHNWPQLEFQLRPQFLSDRTPLLAQFFNLIASLLTPCKEISYSINLSGSSQDSLRDLSLHDSRRADLTSNPFTEGREAPPPPPKALAAAILQLPSVRMPGAQVPPPGLS